MRLNVHGDCDGRTGPLELEGLARHGRGAAYAPGHTRGRAGDLSRFVEAAVNREVLRQTSNDVRARNAHLGEAEAPRLVDEELAAVRAETRAHTRP
jgi:hypothetical protein